jgi:hypothetical protein
MNGVAPDFLARDIIQRKRHAAIAPRGNGRLVFTVSTAIHKACDTEAQRRHMTINALLRLLLTRIVRDKLFDAVIGK